MGNFKKRCLILTGCGLLVAGVAGTASAQDAAGTQEDAIMAPQPAPPPNQPQQAQQPPPPPPVGQPMVSRPVVQIQAPEPPRRAENTIYGEGLGAGLFYSINYERLVVQDLAVRVGFSYLSLSASAGSSSSDAAYMQFPITASYLGLGGDRHIFEVGGGVTLNYTSAAASSGLSSASGAGFIPIGTLFMGYRIHPVDRAGFNFRVGAMALIAQGFSLSNPDPESIGVLPWLYISAGASF